MDDMDHQNDDSFRAGERIDEEAYYDCLEVDDKSDKLGEIWFPQKKNYTILKQEEVAKLQEDDIAKASTFLSVSKSDACLLLLHSNWRTDNLTDAWFADENKIREKAGLLKKPLLDNAGEDLISSSCRLCSYSNSSNISASCGHPFCGDCWTGYITKLINEEGPACLVLRCPEPDCSAVVGPDLVQNVMLATNQEDECYKRYKHYLLRSYLEDRKLIKWCPAPDCNSAIRLDAGGSSTSCYHVSCVCSRSYCWNCEEEENHRPVDCQTAGKWISNILESVHYQRWQNHGKSKEKALEVFDEVKTTVHQELLEGHELDFLLEACKQMIECRQVLRWIVVYDYYNMSDHEAQHPKRKLFECLQGHAEFSVKKLENQVQQFLILANSDPSSSSSVVEKKGFADFRVRLQDLTNMTATYFKNLVRALEHGLPETCCEGASWSCERCTYINAMSSVKCGMCTAHIPEGAGYWSCDKCTYFNPASSTG
ncbi:putative aminoacyltransferase, E1 ubiquitin-activating enzyme [Rosa chinensis]|uniref:RBR-type E3 ubiquitin transferase n=1 Tax=Rosa chinensis TaxID=74649 RepID=A0A2P6R8G8_ROSCH|nr:probable E3 ubiquitin-protein ligase ARI9 [Rosa chinensis]PRQ42738.1 putative aminoacyltransferase, E1 ubiquitin-activating enzyme [Rosa chinensis]